MFRKMLGDTMAAEMHAYGRSSPHFKEHTIEQASMYRHSNGKALPSASACQAGCTSHPASVADGDAKHMYRDIRVGCSKGESSVLSQAEDTCYSGLNRAMHALTRVAGRCNISRIDGADRLTMRLGCMLHCILSAAPSRRLFIVHR
jgi:hypothetical protein